MPIRIVPDIKADDRHPRRKWITKKKKTPDNPRLKGGYDPQKQQDPKWITKKKPTNWITKKKSTNWITKKKKPTEWIKRKPPTDIRKKLTDAFAGGVKGKPHSSPEGQAASVGRKIKRIGQAQQKKYETNRTKPWGKSPKYVPGPGNRMVKNTRVSPVERARPVSPVERARPRYGLGTLVKGAKKIISKLKPPGVFKPKSVPKAVTDKPTGWSPKGSYTKSDDKKITSMLKKLGDEIKAAPLPPQLKKTLKKAQKAFPHKKAKGGRIGLKHGTSAQSHYLQHGYGPTKIQLRSGKPKIAKKGW